MLLVSKKNGSGRTAKGIGRQPVSTTVRHHRKKSDYTPKQLAAIPAKTMRYYDVPGKWTRRIVPHLADKKLNDILVRDFNRYTMGRWGIPFTHGELPCHHETCLWQPTLPPDPPFWDYVKHAACHWLVNFALRLATLVEPKQAWRIVTSHRHSTVWDGQKTLFDLNFLALGIDASECWQMATDKGKVLRPGKYRQTWFPDYYTCDDLENNVYASPPGTFRVRRYGRALTFSLLIKALGDPECEVRRWAAYTISYWEWIFDAESARDALKAATQDEDAEVRRLAARALGTLGLS